MCQTCKEIRAIIHKVDSLVTDELQHTSDNWDDVEQMHSINPKLNQLEVKRGLVMMHLAGYVFARESINAAIPPKRYINAFDATLNIQIFRRVYAMTPEAVSNALHGVDKQELLQKIGEHLIVNYSITSLPDFDNDDNHISVTQAAGIQEITSTEELEQAILRIEKKKANKSFTQPQELSQEGIIDLLNKMDVNDKTPKH